jgi:serine/threonine protein kinase
MLAKAYPKQNLFHQTTLKARHSHPSYSDTLAPELTCFPCRACADVRREIEILHLITPHVNIAGLKDVYEDSYSVHIIIEYCAGGELFAAIVRKGTFSEAGAARIFLQMVTTVHHCHRYGSAHVPPCYHVGCRCYVVWT